MEAGNEAQDDDPIVASYNVYLNPNLPDGRRLFLLRQWNRSIDNTGPAPTEIRIKPQSHKMEMDIPIDINSPSYNREKGMLWGRALHASKAAGWSHGGAGGYGIGNVPQKGKAKWEQASKEHLDWNEAVRQDKVLRSLIHAGGWGTPEYDQFMVGVFKGQDLHLTPISADVHLRPELQHTAALSKLERACASQASASNKDSTATGSSGSSSTASARAIHMTVKTTIDGDIATTETWGDRLRATQAESWHRLRYVDENQEASWDVYNESLILPAKQNSTDAARGPSTQQEESVPRLESKWTMTQLSDAVSGIDVDAQPPKPDSKVQAGSAAAFASTAPTDEGENKKVRPKAGGSAAPRRTSTTRSKPVNIG